MASEGTASLQHRITSIVMALDRRDPSPTWMPPQNQISMLDRLYSLYVMVITTIKGYGDYFWTDVVEKVDEMGEQARAPAARWVAAHGAA
jgi:hypothetical protein